MNNRPDQYADRSYLTVVEIMIMCALARIGGEATCGEIRGLIAESTIDQRLQGPTSSVLRRLEMHEMVVSRAIERKTGTLGRLPNGFTMTPKGSEALERTLAMIDDMRRGADLARGEGRAA